MNKQDVDNIIKFIKNYYLENTFAKGAIIGMSGGKDSLICAKLCIEAIGAENVYGVIMPNGEMPDENDAVETCKLLGIRYSTINISDIYNNIITESEKTLSTLGLNANSVTKQNTPPRIRMSLLYAIGGSMDYLVINTSNLSEIMVGYTTKWGDNVGDLAPIANFTKTEVCMIGEILGLPHHLVYKSPSDGLSGLTDEDNLKIKYLNLDSYIRTGLENEHVEIIKTLHKKSNHKRMGAIKYNNSLPNILKNTINKE